MTTATGERTRIDVRAIERELNELWQRMAKDQPEDKRHPITRTCVLNLAIVTRGGAEAEAATQTVADLTARHPNRAFVISAAPNDDHELLDAWAQTHCQLPSAGRPQICGEQISIEARGAAADRVPGIILSMLVPDVPVMLWWSRGEPFDDTRYTKYTDLIDRIIVDSATFEAPEHGLAQIAAQIGNGPTVSDLSWGRLTPWRELTAQFFDAPALPPHLAEITGVTVDYHAPDGQPHDRSQALLLIGWLAVRLGWHTSAEASAPADADTLQMTAANGATIMIALRPTTLAGDGRDTIAALELTCKRAHFSVRRDSTAGCAVARSEVEGMRSLQRTVRLEQLDDAALLSEELQLLGRDRTFEEVLKVAVALV